MNVNLNKTSSGTSSNTIVVAFLITINTTLIVPLQLIARKKKRKKRKKKKERRKNIQVCERRMNENKKFVNHFFVPNLYQDLRQNFFLLYCTTSLYPHSKDGDTVLDARTFPYFMHPSSLSLSLLKENSSPSPLFVIRKSVEF